MHYHKIKKLERNPHKRNHDMEEASTRKCFRVPNSRRELLAEGERGDRLAPSHEYELGPKDPSTSFKAYLKYGRA